MLINNGDVDFVWDSKKEIMYKKEKKYKDWRKVPELNIHMLCKFCPYAEEIKQADKFIF